MTKRFGGIALVVAALAIGGLVRIGWEASVPASAQVSATAAGASDLVAEQHNLTTVRLRIDGLWCASCSYIAEQALLRTPGVVEARVSGDTGTAVVTFDRTVANITDLFEATGSYGFPSELLPG